MSAASDADFKAEANKRSAARPVADARTLVRLAAAPWSVAILAILCTVVSAEGSARPSLESAALAAGKERFERNCGICHGLDASGGGAFAEILKVEPPDLTVLSKRNNGSFPFTEVYNAIDGRNAPLAHGRAGMPIWGDRYKQSIEGGDETLVRGRILELILYLEFLQSY
jgi:mono/diheme cytochrome c family protein